MWIMPKLRIRNWNACVMRVIDNASNLSLFSFIFYFHIFCPLLCRFPYSRQSQMKGGWLFRYTLVIVYSCWAQWRLDNNVFNNAEFTVFDSIFRNKKLRLFSTAIYTINRLECWLRSLAIFRVRSRKLYKTKIEKKTVTDALAQCKAGK